MAKLQKNTAGYKFGIAVSAILGACVVALLVAGTVKLIQIMFV